MAISSITMKFDHIAKYNSQEKQMVNINSNKTKIFQIMKYLPKKKKSKTTQNNNQKTDAKIEKFSMAYQLSVFLTWIFLFLFFPKTN